MQPDRASPDDQAEHPALPDPADSGGDPACWLDRVCPDCGAMLEPPDAPHRPGCEIASHRETTAQG